MTRALTPALVDGKEENDTNRAAVEAARLCGLVLAGGEGRRLLKFVRRLRGDGLPKQYVDFSGSGSMLQHTYRRVEQLIAPQQIFTVVNQTHLKFPEVKAQLRERCDGTVVVQPMNRETGPGLLLPLTYLQKRHPNAIVAVFPSDQFVVEADRLMRHIRLAHAVVQRHPSNLVLLGVEPSYEESDYGYIVPCANRDITGWGVKKVEAFVEKPDVLEAHELIGRGALWNTMLMVFNAGALFRWVKEIAPDVFRCFARIYDAIGTSAEASTVCSEYAQMRTVNFSKDLLEPLAKQPGRLTVLPVTNLTWSDWGSEDRILSSLASIGKVPCVQKSVTVIQKSNRVRVKRAGDSDRPATYTVQ